MGGSIQTGLLPNDQSADKVERDNGCRYEDIIRRGGLILPCVGQQGDCVRQLSDTKEICGDLHYLLVVNDLPQIKERAFHLPCLNQLFAIKGPVLSRHVG
eukprot:Blabericola_migrator_1__529@NODE_112_length_13896_cov_27_724275_g100_i0_p12_GENE_NODE_112_length_13896_cov_27_724275_g100_i0NODE_112_length_13896_cov_27_724275_g100_i0_p12_ORF_typecomplete_len100_score10_23_NODE_112_length_13896_cov_27_724275_g100_i01096411263